MRRRAKTAFFDHLGKPLLYMAIGCVAALLISQVLLFKESSRHYLSSVDRLEGESVALETPIARGNPVTVIDSSAVASPLTLAREHKNVTVRMLNPVTQAAVYVTVNGEVVGDFLQGEVSVPVFEGDYLAIDATLLKENGSFILQGNDLIHPEDGLLVEGRMRIISIGNVKFRH